jgi:hypothetical protein
MSITQGKPCSNVEVKKGPCGFLTIDFGCGKFHLPRSIAEQLLQKLAGSMDRSRIPLFAEHISNNQKDKVA